MRHTPGTWTAGLLLSVVLAPAAGAQTLTLEGLQATGLERNPTLELVRARLDGAIHDARQAGLLPNPHILFEGERVNDHRTRGGFVSQIIPTSGRLGAGKAAHERDADLAQVLVSKQRLVVENSVRLLYRDVLMAELRVALKQEMVAQVEEELQTIRELVNVGLEDRTDVLETEMDLEHARLDLNEEELERRHLWVELAQMVGDPTLERSPLAGDALELPPEYDYETQLARLLEESPEILLSHAEIAVAEAALEFEKVEHRPDVLVTVGYRRNLGLIDAEGHFVSPRTWEVAFGVDLGGYFWNRNQHTIRKTEAVVRELRAAHRRVELDLREKFVDVFHAYEVERAEAVQYRDEILPLAEEVHALALGRYEDFGEDYGEVLEARAEILEKRGKLLDSVAEVWNKAIHIEGLLVDGGLEEPKLHLMENSATGSLEVEFREPG